MSEVINHKCPSCGATLEFDIRSQRVKCPYCDSEFDVSEVASNDGDLTADFELADNGGIEWKDAELYGISEYQCESCGGNIYSDENTSATLCPYCGNAVMLKGRLSGVLKPDKVIPFQITKERALAGLEEHCGGKKFVPKKFLLNNKLEEVKGLYVPFWVYNADLDGDVMYECVNERTWTSGNTEYTERKYYNVRRAGELSFDHVPADGSSKMPDDLMESIEPFDYGKAEDFTTAYLSGYVADKYDLDQETVRPRVRKRLQEGTSDQFRTTVNGYDQVKTRNVEISAKSSTVDYVLYPVWLMNTDWEGRKFIFAMNGQTGKMVGNLPADMLKLGGATAGIFAAIFVLGTLALGFMADDFIGGAIFGLIVGGIAAAVFYSHFKGSLRTVSFQHGASNYYRSGSMKIRISTDEFDHKELSSRRISND